MKGRLRHLSRRSIFLLVCALFVLGGGGSAIAVAADRGASAPPSQPLDQAIMQALSNTPVDGVSADVTLTSNLFPAGTVLGKLASSYLSGSGHVWISNNGAGRVDLQTGAGRVSAVWDSSTLSIYVAATNTVYRVNLPAHSDGAQTPTLAEIDQVLARIGQGWTISQPQPGIASGQPAYSITLSPKEGGSLLSSVGVTWDADHGTPLRIAVYARGATDPVLALDVTNPTYEAVAPADLQETFPAGATVTDLGSQIHAALPQQAPVSGLDAVTAAAGFPVVAPATLAGETRSSVTLHGETAVVTYGQGLGGVLLIERKAATSGLAEGPLGFLPTATIGGVSAHEITTTLGTAITWTAGGTRYVLAGSLPAATLEQALPGVR